MNSLNFRFRPKGDIAELLRILQKRYTLLEVWFRFAAAKEKIAAIASYGFGSMAA